MKKKIVSIIAAIIFALVLPLGAFADVITPYSELSDHDEFINGATFVLEQTPDWREWLTAELERANGQYLINTITVYGLENFDDEYKTHLFSELQRLNMRICVRIESYSQQFAFTAKDAVDVIGRYSALIDFICKEENRGALQYFALNMPVDDPNVQNNLGGINTDAFVNNQVEYAGEIVSRMRAYCAEKGFNDAKMFLSVFFGWDNTFVVPSYASAGADGYFINNYTYPIQGPMPDENAPTDDIINAARLRGAMEKFAALYPDLPPVVMESGFHTLEYNNGVMPGQTAGLVLNRAVKAIAVKAWVEFYKTNYPNVCGLLYFGYNLINQEGNPPMEMDWTLVYPTMKVNEAENGMLVSNAAVSDDEAASAQQAVRIAMGDGISFSQVPATQHMVISYSASQAVTVDISSDGKVKKTVELPATNGYETYGIPLVIVENYDMQLVSVNGEFMLDTVDFYEKLEAEYAQLTGSAAVQEAEGTSGGKVATGISGEANAISFAGTRGGEGLVITYQSPADTTLALVLDGETFKLPLAATNNFAEVTASLAIPLGADFEVYEDGGNQLALDTIFLTGAPAPAQSGAAPQDVSGGGDVSVAVQDNGQNAEGGIPVFVWVIAGAAIVIVVVMIVVLAKAKRRK